jgi:16S rRNA (cytosine967-C5)-methyltransferase
VNQPPKAAGGPAAQRGASLPLSRLMHHTADAVQAVRAGRSLTEALLGCPPAARPGTQALSFHTLRHLGQAIAARAMLVPKPPPPALDALLLTAVSLLWPVDSPLYAPHTVVDQAVAAARQRGRAGSPFVNAVLRRFLRELPAIVAAVALDPVARHNHPAWWIERLRHDWPQHWLALLDAANEHPPMTLRVNARRSTAAAYVQRLAQEGLAATAIDLHAVMLARPCPVTQLPGFTAGDVSVQDAAAQRAAPLLLGSGLPAGARVLDACAAPGGKTAHLLELADLDLLALDSDPARLARVDETLARLSLPARTVVGDAGAPAAWWDGRRFDAIQLDAPCTASGIVRRHPDVRWLRRPGDVDALARTQARLLDALWPLLAPGGRLLYCTCSVFRAEGQEQIDAFLQRQSGAALATDRPSPGHLLPLPDNPGQPGHAGGGAAADGFFYALIAKT